MASNYPITLKYLKRYGDQVEQEMETRLYNQGKYATGTLYDSIRYEVKEDKEKLSIGFFMIDYGFYVDKGTKPNKYANSTGKGTGNSPFITSLMKWCEIRGLPRNAAFPIRRKIWRDGIPPTNFFTISVRRRAGQLAQGVEKSMAQDLDNYIKKNYSRKR